MRVCLFADAKSVHVHQLARSLASHGATVHVVTHKPFEVPGATVERFRVPPAGWTNLRRWESRRRRYIADFFQNFDVVNMHFLADWKLDEELLRSSDRDAALIVTAWGSDIVDPPGETPASHALSADRKQLLQRADMVTVCGPSFASVVAEYGKLRTDDVAVVPFGVDLSRFDPSVTAPRPPDEPLTIGFFKGFRPVYGPTILIQAIPLIIRESRHCRIQLVGDGAELSQCQAMARQLGVESYVEWIPRQDHSRLPPLMAHWSISVIPSIHEAFGVAALESSAMQLPVVASDVCGLRDTVIDNHTGLLCPPGDPNALAKAVLLLRADVQLRTRMGLAGRQMVEQHYNWNRLAPAWLQAYERAREERCVMT